VSERQGPLVVGTMQTNGRSTGPETQTLKTQTLKTQTLKTQTLKTQTLKTQTLKTQTLKTQGYSMLESWDLPQRQSPPPAAHESGVTPPSATGPA